MLVSKDESLSKRLDMSQKGFDGVEQRNGRMSGVDEFDDVLIPCIDCESEFVWTAGEQAFFRQKELQNPPKRCKNCKKAKNRRLEAIEMAKITGKKTRIDVQAKCARCTQPTTIPFYPSQGRPVYCRACFIEMKSGNGNEASMS